MTRDLRYFYDRFPKQSDCLSFLEAIKWQDDPICPKCGFSTYSPIKFKKAYHCNYCNRTFTVTTKTLFHKSKIDLQKWFYAIQITLEPTEQISIRELAIKMEVAKDTAWSVQNKIKNALIKSPHLLLNLDKHLNVDLWQK